MAQVFLSYDRDDAGRAESVAEALEDAGHQVWWDRHILGGAQYSQEIEQALDGADAVVVLWSSSSVKSAWVRDEAAAGRDSNRLVPVLVEDIKPPMGFRQYQSIDLSDWDAKKGSRQLDALLRAVDSLRGASGPVTAPPPPPSPSKKAHRPNSATSSRAYLAGAVAVLLLGAGAGGLWLWGANRSGPPTLGVVPADSSPASQAMARSLLVKLGTLQGDMPNAVRLVEAGKEEPDLRVTVSAGGDEARPSSLVSIASVREGAVLWSQEFSQPGLSKSDLEEQTAYATANVLGCAIDEASGEFGRLKQDIRLAFLSACAMRSEIGWDARPVLPKLRAVVRAAPKFRPGWVELLGAESSVVSYLDRQTPDTAGLKRQLREDIASARKVDPDMAVATLAEIELLDHPTASDVMAIVDRAKAQDPDNPTVLGSRSGALLALGRLNEAIDDAKRAAELEPLSPASRANYIYTLAYAGQIDQARSELARAKRLWSASEAIRAAEFSLELRFGDFEKAMQSDLGADLNVSTYATVRRNPTPENVAGLVAQAKRLDFAAGWAFAAQALGELHQVDTFYEIFERPRSLAALRGDSYLLFRPWMADIRRDRRFMGLATRIGLASYWRQSGNWPDFCFDADLPYDCKTEAARHGA